ncbi:MAG TPA: hypothetical protein VK110_08710 [Salinisphaeraceae bacterium]|nr:hypothetical protein [Salinisphaeraceae bacterium]
MICIPVDRGMTLNRMAAASTDNGSLQAAINTALTMIAHSHGT